MFSANPMNFLLNKIKNDPRIANNPQAMGYIKVLESGDAEKGSEIAKNLCNTYGVSQEDGLKQAQSFFQNMPFQNR